ncbi:protein of unknown function [Magnetospirillum sp. XM-1]|nr:protein of unknown function [Magnetospirillum sp. XM-1]
MAEAGEDAAHEDGAFDDLGGGADAAQPGPLDDAGDQLGVGARAEQAAEHRAADTVLGHHQHDRQLVLAQSQPFDQGGGGLAADAAQKVADTHDLVGVGQHGADFRIQQGLGEGLGAQALHVGGQHVVKAGRAGMDHRLDGCERGLGRRGEGGDERRGEGGRRGRRAPFRHGLDRRVGVGDQAGQGIGLAAIEKLGSHPADQGRVHLGIGRNQRHLPFMQKVGLDGVIKLVGGAARGGLGARFLGRGLGLGLGAGGGRRQLAAEIAFGGGAHHHGDDFGQGAAAGKRDVVLAHRSAAFVHQHVAEAGAFLAEDLEAAGQQVQVVEGSVIGLLTRQGLQLRQELSENIDNRPLEGPVDSEDRCRGIRHGVNLNSHRASNPRKETLTRDELPITKNDADLIASPPQYPHSA